MSEDSIRAIMEQAVLNWQAAVHGNPGKNTWGFYSYHQSYGITGGFGSFIWFTDRSSMLDFFTTSLPYTTADCSTHNPEEIAEIALRINDIIKEMKSGVVDDETAVLRLNEVLQSHIQIEWMGTVESLFRGEHPYAFKVRSSFRDENADPGAPIKPEEQEEFCEFLEEWGI
jgi:hypothetical protein